MLKSVVFRPVYRQAFRPLAAQKINFARFYSDKKNLLDDDMIAKAGIDPENVDGSKEKKWESTARAPRSESRQVETRTRRAWVFTSLAIFAGIAYLIRPFSDDEKEKHKDVVSNGWDIENAYNRLKSRYFTTVDTFAAPVFDKLLPDPIQDPRDPMGQFTRPTLVIAVDDFLIKSEWTRKYGWRVAKRPGMDYFLGYLSQYYEIVLFSDKYQAMAAETVQKLDPLGAAVSYALFREATRYDKGALVKDLRHLNRDLKRVIVLDVDPEAVKLQPENALVFPEWDGKPGDTDLVRIIPLLEWIGAQRIQDVRPIIKSYHDAPHGVIAEFERRDKINRQKWAEKHSGSKASINSLLGIGSSNAVMPQDAVRMESQKNYQRFKKHVEEYGQKMREQEEQKLAEALNEHQMTLNKWLSGDVPSPEELAKKVKEVETPPTK